MSLLTTALGLHKAVGSDNRRSYLKTLLAASLDILDKAVGPVHNVRGYGASPSATAAANTTAVRAAIAAAVAAGGGIVEVPGGPGAVYQLAASGATYTLTLASNVTLRSDGATLKRAAGNTEKLLGAAAALADVRLEGLTIDNADAAVFGGGGLYVPNGSSRITVERVRFVGLAAAGVLEVASGAVQNRHVRLVDCAFERTLANGTAAAENVQSVTIYDTSHAYVERCRFDNVNALYLVALNATACPTTDPMRHVYLRGCTFERIKTTCVFATPGGGTAAAMAHVYIEDNSFLNIGKEIEKGAIQLSSGGTTWGATVRNCHVRDWGYTGSSPIGAAGNAAQAIATGGPGALLEGLLIEGCRLDGRTLAGVVPPTGNYGISIGEGTVDVTLRANRIRGTGYAGVRVQGGATNPVQVFLLAGNTVQGCCLHNDATLRQGGIVLVDYATDGTLSDNICLDNGAGGGATAMDAGIALRTGSTATAIRDVKLADNHCYDTRSGGSKTQLYGIRIGDTDAAAAAQPTRVTLLANDVGVAGASGGNATAGLFHQTTVDLGYVVGGNPGQGASGVYAVGSEFAQTGGNGARIGVLSGSSYQAMALGYAGLIDADLYNLAANAAGNLLVNARSGQTLNLRNNNADVLTIAATIITAAQLLSTKASATGGAGVRLPHGAAPTSPVNGDMWTTTAGLFVRINGATVGPLS